MEAKDTVMSKEQLDAIDLKNAESNFIDALWDTARQQAEISFKAGFEEGRKVIPTNEVQGTIYLEGKQTGIREVVEWVEENAYPPAAYKDIRRFRYDDWQAKLKEWGIDHE